MPAASRPSPGRVRLLVPTVVTAVAVAVLIGLGAWQLERRAWKHDLIATLEARTAAEPVDVAGAAMDEPAMLDFRRAFAGGVFDEPTFRLVARTRDGRVGWEAVTLLTLTDGHRLLVNRGWVPVEMGPERVAPPTGEVRVEGVLRLPGPAGRFTPENDAARNEWYRPDPAEMAEAADLDPGDVLPVILVETGAAPEGVYPAPAAVSVELTDNHLQYALTWLTLAAAVLVIYFLWVLRQRRAGRT